MSPPYLYTIMWRLTSLLFLLTTVNAYVTIGIPWLEDVVVDLNWPNCTERIKTYAREDQQYWVDRDCDDLDKVLTYEEMWTGCIEDGLTPTFYKFEGYKDDDLNDCFNYTAYMRHFPNVDLFKFPMPIGDLLYFPTEKEIAHINWTIN